MKIEFVADIGSSAGYAAHARLILRALHQNMDPRFQIQAVNRQKEASSVDLMKEDIAALESFSKSFHGKPDIRVYFEPPQYIKKENGVRIVGFTQWETTKNCKEHIASLDQADLLLTSSTDAVAAFRESGVKPRALCIHGPIFPHTMTGEIGIRNLTVRKHGEPIPRAERLPVIGYMAQWSPRKNIEAFLIDTISGFKRDEVSILLKTYKSARFDDTEKILQEVSRIKASCHLQDTPQIDVITDHLSDEEIFQFFNTVDIFYSPSRGEGFSVPVSMAAAANKWIVSSAYGGPRDYLPKECLVPGHFSPANGMLAYAGDQFWFNINEEYAIDQLRRCVWEVKNGRASNTAEEAEKKAGPAVFAKEFFAAMSSLGVGTKA